MEYNNIIDLFKKEFQGKTTKGYYWADFRKEYSEILRNYYYTNDNLYIFPNGVVFTKDELMRFKTDEKIYKYDERLQKYKKIKKLNKNYCNIYFSHLVEDYYFYNGKEIVFSSGVRFSKEYFINVLRNMNEKEIYVEYKNKIVESSFK